MSGLARLGQVFEDAARTATAEWLEQFLADRGLGDAVDDPEWATLLTTARQAALAGHDLDTLLDDAIAMRSMAGAESTAAVLDWRVGMLADVSVPARARGPMASLPPTDGPAMEVARQAGELIRERWRQIRATLAETTATLPWAAELGPQPTEAEERSAWLTAATAVTAYRERFEVPDYTQMVGARPSGPRPDAQAAWDHARLQADRYLARQLRHLTDEQLSDLAARQQTILGEPPPFDPSELAAARAGVTTPGHRSPPSGATVVGRREEEARAHAHWRRAANDASDLGRQFQVERSRRQQPRSGRRQTTR